MSNDQKADQKATDKKNHEGHHDLNRRYDYNQYSHANAAHHVSGKY